ncbi:unnamed protein product [Schistosoma rodhaini]|nr:unnamed protein product [Schistosoma rodhaini]
MQFTDVSQKCDVDPELKQTIQTSSYININTAIASNHHPNHYNNHHHPRTNQNTIINSTSNADDHSEKDDTSDKLSTSISHHEFNCQDETEIIKHSTVYRYPTYQNHHPSHSKQSVYLITLIVFILIV